MRGRPRTPIGTWGKFTTLRIKTGYQARTRFRNSSGQLIQVAANAKTATGARTALLERLSKLSAETTATEGLTPAATIAELLEYWLEHKTDVLPQTIDDYKQTIQGSIVPRIGGILLQEITPGRVAALLDSLSPGVANRSRSILSQAFALAVAHDATPTNPLLALPRKKRTRPTVEVINPEQLVHLRAVIGQWSAGEIDDNGNPQTPDKRTHGRAPDLLDFLDMLLATGCRTGELAAIRWQDINLDATPPTISVGATIVRRSGQGLIRQPFTKTKDKRVLLLPPFAVQILTRIHDTRPWTRPQDPVFPSSTGGFRDPNNINKQFRRARKAAGMPDVQFRTMRRTVATLIADESRDTEAAAQLGHASVSMTRRHYIQARGKQAPDLTEILQRFAE